jgi:hypothetical protein
MKLFLLNTMKNKEPSKISLTFLVFFYHFLQLFKVLLKKKKEKTGTVLGRFQPRRPKSRGKRARARARWLFCEKSLGFLANWERARLLFLRVTDRLQKGP